MCRKVRLSGFRKRQAPGEGEWEALGVPWRPAYVSTYCIAPISDRPTDDGRAPISLMAAACIAAVCLVRL